MRRTRQLLLALLGGLLVTVGGVVAPALFALLEDRAEAGRIAGALFHLTNGLTLVLVAAIFCLGGFRLPRRARAVLLTPAVCLAVSEWGLHPLIEAQKASAGTHTPAFALLHGLSSVLFALATVAAWAALLGELRAAERVNPAG
jgi:Domain of unknown function (DUF4149)